MEPTGRTTECPVRNPRSEKNGQERPAKANPFKRPLCMRGKQFAVLKVTDQGKRVVRGLSETGSSHEPVKALGEACGVIAIHHWRDVREV